MMEWQRDSAVPVDKFDQLSPEERKDKFTIGVLMDKEAPGFLDEYEKVKARARSLSEMQVIKEKGDNGPSI